MLNANTADIVIAVIKQLLDEVEQNIVMSRLIASANN